ncbi:oxaloacetate decarboxylase subunit gamma [Vibrio ostreicida]|uniref:oxaloacetate decarboxylase subunit gamma n=1 Tax=Vibrio ostreicida TaxID=526588 RepID=UPI0009710E7A|nr:oxaloacetate decarboxylase subunit gamma [Vibrio ostreicida]
MENIGSLLADAATLMFTGMLVVFTFLTALVYLVSLMSKLVPDDIPEPLVIPTHHSDVQSASQVCPRVMAAISAAVQQYRVSDTK